MATKATGGHNAPPEPTYYGVLGVEEWASPKEIRGAYRRLARVHHPDRFPGDPARAAVATVRMRTIAEAWRVLNRPERRQEYDDELAESRAPLAGWKPPERDVIRYGSRYESFFDYWQNGVAATFGSEGSLLRLLVATSPLIFMALSLVFFGLGAVTQASFLVTIGGLAFLGFIAASLFLPLLAEYRSEQRGA